MAVRIRFAPMKGAPRNRKGMTLVEVMVAAAIFAFCLSGLLLTYMNLFTMTDLTRDFTYATNAMQAELEQIRQVAFANLTTLDNTTFTIPGLASGNSCGVVQVTNTTYSDLVQVRLVASFKSRNRLIGEDADLDGVLDSGEDANGNGILDSPAELATLIASYY